MSLDQQIDHLVAKGMAVPDRQVARHALQHLSYYRLSAYWLPFEYPKGAEGPRFRPGANFDQLLALYDFDRRLRLLLLDAIERIEVAIRGSWAYVMALEGGPHGYLSAALYRDRAKFDANFRRLAEGVEQSRDTFIIHYKARYSDPAMPPVWMSAELMAFGQLSHWYALLLEPALRQKVAAPFGLDEAVLVPFAHHLSIVRNICAHHGRLWNRVFRVPMRLPRRNPEALARSVSREHDRLLYNSLAMIAYLDRLVVGGSGWGERLIDLIGEHPTGDLRSMGFPVDWRARPIWR